MPKLTSRISTSIGDIKGKVRWLVSGAPTFVSRVIEGSVSDRKIYRLGPTSFDFQYY